MFRNSYQGGFLSLLYSIGSKPLQIWDKQVQNGHIKRLTDADIQSSVLEILGSNVSTTFVSCPADAADTLGIKMPFLVLIIKNLHRFFSFEVQVMDDKGIKRRFRASTFQSATRVKPFICSMPLKLDDGWNQIQFNLADFCQRAYKTRYVETLRIQVHCSCRVRRIFFSDRLYAEEELPTEYKLYVPSRLLTAERTPASAAAAAEPAEPDEDFARDASAGTEAGPDAVEEHGLDSEGEEAGAA